MSDTGDRAPTDDASPGDARHRGGHVPPDEDDRPARVAASDLVASCEGAWSQIQARHPQVPDAVIVLGSGVERGRLVKLGHWWGGQWRVGDEARGEVLLAGEALHLPPEAVVEVLLHEAAHGLNAARGVRDTSRGGRYHNAHFKTAAAEVGLRPRRLDPYGWARTVLTPATAEDYADVITAIGAQMRLARGLPAARGVEVEGVGVEGGRIEGVGVGGAEAGGGRPGGSGQAKRPAAECGCDPGRKLRMAPSVLARGPVICGLCGSDFALPGEVELRPPTTRGTGRERAAETVETADPGRTERDDAFDLRTIDLPPLESTTAAVAAAEIEAPGVGDRSVVEIPVAEIP